MYLPDDLIARLEHEWARHNLALGQGLPKATFLRSVLERGVELMSEATLSGGDGLTVPPSAPEKGLRPKWDAQVPLSRKEAAIERAWVPIRNREKHSEAVKQRLENMRQLELANMPEGNYRIRHTEASTRALQEKAEQAEQAAKARRARGKEAVVSALPSRDASAAKRKRSKTA